MAINFPNSPSVNDIHVSGANRWQWNGSSWTRIGGVSSDADVINSTNDNSTTTLYPVMVSGTGSQTAKIATSATKSISFDASDGDLTVAGNISVGGTITYEDVKNVDAIGIVTARAGVIVTGNVDTDTLNVSGISTLTGGINVGTAATICSAGNISIDKPGAGIITATRFVGSGVSLTDVISGVGIRTAGGTVGWAATILDFRGPGVTTAYYSSVTGVGTINFTGGGGSASVSISETAPSSPAAGDMWWDSDVGNLQIYYTDANSSQWVTANNAGPQGPQGVQGAVGAQGAQGHQGVQGAVGAQGAQGHQGVQGAQGHQGRQGSVGIASLTISQTPPSSPAQGDMWWDSDDSTLGLYYNDGNSSQWVNINHGPSGAQGAAGAQGAQGHQGVQGTAGTNATISNNADNRVITGGSGTNLNGESNLTFDGNTLSVTKKIESRGPSGDAEFNFIRTNAAGSNGNTFGNIVWSDNNSNNVAQLRAVRATAVDDASLVFSTRPTGGSVTERLRITSAGKMGLGTNNPTQYFHVVGNSASVQTEESGGGIVRMQSGGSSGNIGMYSNHDLLLRTNSLERLRIDASGDIGLGIANPNLSGYGSPVVSIGHNSSNNYSVLELTGNKTSNTGTNAPISTIVGYNVGGASRIASINFCRYNANNNGAITFNTYSSGVEGERLVITAAGLMGLGMTPTRMFEVKDSTNANRIMNIRGTGTSGAFLAFLDANTTDDSKCRIGSVGGNSIGMRGDAHYFQNGAGTNRMVIDSSGAVTKPLQPSFMARHSSGITLNYGGQNHTYNTEMWDLNSDYSTSTGKFVAPVSGYYYMNHTIAVSGNNSGCLEAKLAINDTEVLRSYIYYEGGQAGGTAIACGVRYMAANDELRPTTHWSGSSGTGTHNGNSNNPICFFQAHLVH